MANQRLNATIKIGGVLDKSFRKNIGLIRSGFESVGDKIKEVKERQKELSKHRRVLEKEGREVEDLDREYEDLERTLGDLTRKQRRWEDAVRASNRVGDAFGRSVRSIGDTTRRIGLGVTAVAGTIGLVTGRAAANIDRLNRSADRLGLTPEFLSELSYAASQFGVDTEALTDGLKELSIRADEFAETGKGGGADAFKRLGLSPDDIAAVKGDTEALFNLVRDRISEVEDVSARQRIADEVFGGQGGEQLVEMLALTRAELEAIREEAREVGAVVTEEQTRVANAFQKATNSLGSVLRATMNQIGVELMPAITRSMEDAKAFIIANQDEIEAFGREVGDVMEKVVPKIGDMVKGMADFTVKVGEAIDKAAQMVGGYENLGKAVGVALGVKVLAPIGRLGLALGGLGWSLAKLVGLPTLIGAAFKTMAATVGVQAAAAATSMEAAAARIKRAWTFSGALGFLMKGGAIGAGIGVGLGIKPTADGTLQEGAETAPAADPEALNNDAQSRQDAQKKPPTFLERWGLATPAEPPGKYLGGIMGRRPYRVGEQGEETIFPTQGAYVATASATQRLDRAVNNVAPLVRAAGGPGALMERIERIKETARPQLFQPKVMVPKAEPGRIIEKGGRVIERIKETARPQLFQPKVMVPKAEPGRIIEKGGRVIERIKEVARPQPTLGAGLALAQGRARDALAPAAAPAIPSPVDVGREIAASVERALGGMKTGGPAAPIHQTVHVNAAHMPVEALAEELERRAKALRAGALFDQPHGYGQYGGA